MPQLNSSIVPSFQSSFLFTFFHTIFLCLVNSLGSNTFLLLLLLKYRAPTVNASIIPFITFLGIAFISSVLGFTINTFVARHHVIIVILIFLLCVGIYQMACAINLESISIEENLLNIIKTEISNIKYERETKVDINNQKTARTLTVIDECFTEESKSEMLEPLLAKSKFCPDSKEPEDHLSINEITYNSYTEIYKNMQTSEMIWDIFKSVFLFELFNITQLGIIAMSAMYDPIGAFTGSLCSFILILLLVMICGKKLSKFINEKTMKITSGFFFVVYAVEIFYTN